MRGQVRYLLDLIKTWGLPKPMGTLLLCMYTRREGGREVSMILVDQ